MQAAGRFNLFIHIRFLEFFVLCQVVLTSKVYDTLSFSGIEVLNYDYREEKSGGISICLVKSSGTVEAMLVATTLHTTDFPSFDERKFFISDVTIEKTCKIWVFILIDAVCCVQLFTNGDSKFKLLMLCFKYECKHL